MRVSGAGMDWKLIIRMQLKKVRDKCSRLPRDERVREKREREREEGNEGRE